MSNPAFSRDLPRWWAWIPCGLAITAGDSFAGAHPGSLTASAVGFGIALGAGVAWQLLNRRDLADRLRLLSLLLALAIPLVLVAAAVDLWIAPVDAHVGPGSFPAFAFAVGGLVLAEQWLRWHEQHAAVSDR